MRGLFSRRRGPEEPLDAASLLDQGRYAQAERAAAAACAADPGDPDAWTDRGLAAYCLGHFEDAVRWLGEALRLDAENAEAWHHLGRARLWLDDRRGADEAMRRAAELDPDEYVRPLRLPPAEFDRIAAEVWRTIPADFAARLGNTLVVVEELPDPDDVEDGFDPDTLGVYEGGTVLADDMPERIVLFQRNHEAICDTLGALREEVRRTVLHEVGHHFGMEEGELPY